MQALVLRGGGITEKAKLSVLYDGLETSNQQDKISERGTKKRQREWRPAVMVNPSFLDGETIFPITKRSRSNAALRGLSQVSLVCFSLELSLAFGLISTSPFQT